MPILRAYTQVLTTKVLWERSSFVDTKLQTIMEMFNSLQFIQAGIKVEQFTYTSRYVPLRDLRRLWSGHHSFTLAILLMNRFTHNLHTVTMVFPILQMNRMEFTQEPRPMG